MADVQREPQQTNGTSNGAPPPPADEAKGTIEQNPIFKKMAERFGVSPRSSGTR